jgi:hypothetical protein
MPGYQPWRQKGAAPDEKLIADIWQASDGKLRRRSRTLRHPCARTLCRAYAPVLPWCPNNHAGRQVSQVLHRQHLELRRFVAVAVSPRAARPVCLAGQRRARSSCAGGPARDLTGCRELSLKWSVDGCCRVYFFFGGDGDDGRAGPGVDPPGTPPPKMMPELPVSLWPRAWDGSVSVGLLGRAGPAVPPLGMPPPKVTPELPVLTGSSAQVELLMATTIAAPAISVMRERAHIVVLHCWSYGLSIGPVVGCNCGHHDHTFFQHVSLCEVILSYQPARSR